ncbi:MAG: type II toxin-antitoxin system VapC family toxin [Bacteroidota bacterium]
MSYLIDTHVIIWALERNPLLSKNAISLIEDEDNEIFFSTVSLWEIAIKKSIGKLKLRYSINSITEALEAQQLMLLPLAAPSIEEVENLPFPKSVDHNDPFDRAIIAQAMHHELIIITKDKMFKHYDVKTQW